MNERHDITVKPVNSSAPLAGAPAACGTQFQQREKKLPQLREKYDAMLYVVELMAAFYLLDNRNSGQAKMMEDVKSMAARARNEIYG